MSIPIVMDGGYGSVVLTECRRLANVVQPISDRYFGPLRQATAHNTLFPFALLLGNHSSGKSSFINYLLKRKTQTTGVAPTDDNFTVIGPGEEDVDRNGPALIGDPDLGFSDLKNFGTTLINHTQLKVRTNIAVKDFMIVDSPGMIDSPGSASHPVGSPQLMDRGYNFDAVCRWYAERADVILLFFDPDKPGTTGETLSVLTKSLAGFDHKLLIILNKADQFTKIHDFARAYGSLCWNLSKVIPRKDLPRIHTMCVPIHSTASPATHATYAVASAECPPSPARAPSPLGLGDGKRFIDQAIFDLEETREEVIREVYNAPKRRVDNEISRLFEHVTLLSVHCRLLDAVVCQYRQRLWGTYFAGMASVAASATLTVAASALQRIVAADPGSQPIASAGGSIADRLATSLNNNALVVGTAAVSALVTAGVMWWQQTELADFVASFAQREAYAEVFQDAFAKEIGAQDEFTLSVGSQVLDQLPANLPVDAIETLQRVAEADVKALERILTVDIANLRRRASPAFPTLAHIAAPALIPLGDDPHGADKSKATSGLGEEEDCVN